MSHKQGAEGQSEVAEGEAERRRAGRKSGTDQADRAGWPVA